MALEAFYGAGAAVLLVALIWGTVRYRQRTRTEIMAGEQKTRELYGKD